MKYETIMHLPQQVEVLLAAELEKNVELFKQTIKVIVNLLNNDTFKKDIEKDFENHAFRIQEAQNKFIKQIKTLTESNNYDDLMIGFTDEIKELEMDLNTINEIFMETVRVYVIEYTRNLEFISEP